MAPFEGYRETLLLIRSWQDKWRESFNITLPRTCYDNRRIFPGHLHWTKQYFKHLTCINTWFQPYQAVGEEDRVRKVKQRPGSHPAGRCRVCLSDPPAHGSTLWSRPRRVVLGRAASCGTLFPERTLWAGMGLICYVNRPTTMSAMSLSSIADLLGDLLWGVWFISKVLSFHSWIDQCLVSSGCLRSPLGLFWFGLKQWGPDILSFGSNYVPGILDARLRLNASASALVSLRSDCSNTNSGTSNDGCDLASIC